ncbi:MAG TPA: hypothetical protein VJB96_02515, partial [Patescibacteria group bacterium]|nr:hypothetical protein [Patescibacteria group bacterium]
MNEHNRSLSLAKKKNTTPPPPSAPLSDKAVMDIIIDGRINWLGRRKPKTIVKEKPAEGKGSTGPQVPDGGGG